VARGGELVVVEGDVVLGAAADGDARRVEDELGALVQRRALQHDQPAHQGLGWAAIAQARGGSFLRCEDEALLRHPQILAGGAHDPPDEQVEQDDEADLQE
jgi:hypothetical protein